MIDVALRRGNEFGELGCSIPGSASTEATGVMQGLKLIDCQSLLASVRIYSLVCSLFLSIGGEGTTGFEYALEYEYEVIPVITGTFTHIHSITILYFPLVFQHNLFLAWILNLTENKLKKYTGIGTDVVILNMKSLQEQDAR